jgi:hypothetical protein
MKARQEKSAAIIATLFDLWQKELPRLSGKSKLPEAIRYTTSRRIALERFLSDGRIEIDSNIIEPAIRAFRGQPRRWTHLGEYRHRARQSMGVRWSASRPCRRLPVSTRLARSQHNCSDGKVHRGL